MFLLGWEIAAVAAWLLVVWDYRNQKIRFAGFNYLVSTHVGLFFLLAAFMVMHSQTGSMDFRPSRAFLRAPEPAAQRHLRAAGHLLRAQVGLLPVPHLAAARPLRRAGPRLGADVGRHPQGRAVRPAALHPAASARPSAWMGWYLIAFSALSALMGVLYTTSQRDLKRLLGYSSTENVGIAGIGFGIGYLGLAWHQPALVAARASPAASSTSSTTPSSSACSSTRPAPSTAPPTPSTWSGSAGWPGACRGRPASSCWAGWPSRRCRRSTASSASSSSTPGSSTSAAPAGIERGTFIGGGGAARLRGRGLGAGDDARLRPRLPRDAARPAVHCDGEVPPSMRLPHGGARRRRAGAGAGARRSAWPSCNRPVRLFLVGAGGAAPAAGWRPARLLGPARLGRALLLLVLAALFLLRRWLLRGAPAPRQRHLGLRLRRRHAAHAVHRHLLLGAVHQRLRHRAAAAAP